MSANARKMQAGSACRPPRGRAGDAASETAISTALRREQPGRADIEHDRHQQVDQHRGDGRTDGASRRRPHDQAQNVDRERSPQRVDEADEERGQKAPRIEPMPPMTMTTNARMRMLSPMPGSTDRMGAIMMPAKPASMAPKPNTIMNRRRILTPSADTIAALVAPARTSMPMRVCATSA